MVLTDHVDKNGRPKIVQQCSLPLTGARVASKIITDLVSSSRSGAIQINSLIIAVHKAVFDVDRQAGVLTLMETAPGVTVDEIKSKTDALFEVSRDLKQM